MFNAQSTAKVGERATRERDTHTHTERETETRDRESNERERETCKMDVAIEGET